MCIATGPVVYIWTVIEKREGKPDWIKAYFSREDWATEAAGYWRSSKWYCKSHFIVEKHELDWYMRCH